MQAFTLQQHLFKEINYPPRYQAKELLKTVAIQFAVIFIFLLLFKPFEVYEPEYKMSYVLICAIHALSPALIIYAYFYGLSYLHQSTSKLKVWTLLKEYTHLAIVFFLTGAASFLLRSLIYNNPDNWSWHYLGEEVFNCYLAGIFFYCLLLFANSYYGSYKTIVLPQEPVAENEGKNTASFANNTEVFIKTQVQQDDFRFNPAQLLFAKADGNYIELTLSVNNQVNTELKRISLKQFEGQLTAYPFLFKCHRAYLVNLQQVNKVAGNAQGYTLSLNMTNENVPVSRTQLELFNESYAQLG